MPSAQGNLVASTLAKILSSLLATSGDASLASVECLSQANRDQVHAWNDTVCIDPVDRCIQDVIADRVLEQPDSEAVCAWDGSFTYGELDTVTTRLAGRLVQLGVGPEVLVPLCFDKSVSDAPLIVPLITRDLVLTCHVPRNGQLSQCLLC